MGDVGDVFPLLTQLTSLLSLSPGSSPVRLKELGTGGLDVGGEGVINAWAPSLHQVSCNRCFVAVPESRNEVLRWEEGDLVTPKPSLATGVQ